MTLRVLLDSGVSENLNVGDLALFDEAKGLFSGCELKVLGAGSFKITSSLRWCEMYFMVSGGLLKSCAEKRFMIRKLYAVLLARLLGKKVFVDSQTVYLSGFWMAVFKLVFYRLPFLVRDSYSLADCNGMKCLLGYEPMLKKANFNKQNIIVVDNRLFNLQVDLGFLYKLVDGLVYKFKCEVKIVDTAGVSDWASVMRRFGSAEYVVSGSYHGCVFGVNGNATVFYLSDRVFGDYTKRKLSILQEVKT